MESKKEFIEIVNWEKAQPLMKGENNQWFKKYTSTLDNDKVIKLDDAASRLIDAMWSLAAKFGKYLPNDTKWLKLHIPYLQYHNIEPNLEPLINATDMLGRSDPFIRIVDTLGEINSENGSGQEIHETQAAKDDLRATSDEKYDKVVAFVGAQEYVSARAVSSQFGIAWERANAILKSLKDKGLLGKFVKSRGYVVKVRAQSEESRVEETIPYRVSGEKKENLNPNGFKRKDPTAEAQRQRKALMQAQAQKQPQEPAYPINPNVPDESAVSSPDGRTQPTSSFRGGSPQPLGRVIKGDFKPHKLVPECREFAVDVVTALGISLECRDELGAFESLLFYLKGQCGSRVVIDELKEKALQKARWINSPKCKSKKTKGGLLTHIMYGEMRKRGIKLPDVRASPSM